MANNVLNKQILENHGGVKQNSLINLTENYNNNNEDEIKIFKYSDYYDITSFKNSIKNIKIILLFYA